ncbi:MAG: methyltransferase domain-containing protein [Planctomycetota bacterium]
MHRDGGLVVVNKPHGMAVEHHGSGGKAPLTERLSRFMGRSREGDRGGRPQLFLLTPLDREAAGIVVYARSGAIAGAVSSRLKGRKAKRGYSAVIHGELPVGETRTIQSFLILNARGVPEAVDPAQHMADEPARGIIHVRVMEAANGVSLVKVRAETDLPMQVRAQLAEIGHPVVGDRAYPPGEGQTAESPKLAMVADELLIPPKDARDDALSLRLPKTEWFQDLLEGKPVRETREVRGAEGGREQVRWEDERSSWQHVADWYADLVGGGRSDFHEHVVHPGVMELIKPTAEHRVLDVACGEGALARLMAERGADVVGVDLAPDLIERAAAQSPERVRFFVGDAKQLGEIEAVVPGAFDAATCVLALMNIDFPPAVFKGVAAALKPGGSFVAVVLHPAFRAPGQTSWGWATAPDGAEHQFRRVDAYLGSTKREIVMNPGEVAQGAEPITTTTHHRALSTYLNGLADAGLLVDRVEEWTSHRTSEPGPRADEENRARDEFPMFLAIRAVKPTPSAGGSAER